MNALERLKAIRELLADEKRWTQHVYARDESGKKVDPWEPEAICWCILGAAIRVAEYRDTDDRVFSREMRVAIGLAPTGLVSPINDDATHAEVLARLDAGIAKLEKGEAV